MPDYIIGKYSDFNLIIQTLKEKLNINEKITISDLVNVLQDNNFTENTIITPIDVYFDANSTKEERAQWSDEDYWDIARGRKQVVFTYQGEPLYCAKACFGDYENKVDDDNGIIFLFVRLNNNITAEYMLQILIKSELGETIPMDDRWLMTVHMTILYPYSMLVYGNPSITYHFDETNRLYWWVDNGEEVE